MLRPSFILKFGYGVFRSFFPSPEGGKCLISSRLRRHIRACPHAPLLRSWNLDNQNLPETSRTHLCLCSCSEEKINIYIRQGNSNLRSHKTSPHYYCFVGPSPCGGIRLPGYPVRGAYSVQAPGQNLFGRLIGIFSSPLN